MKAKCGAAVTCFILILLSLCFGNYSKSRLNYLCNCVTGWDKGGKAGEIQGKYRAGLGGKPVIGLYIRGIYNLVYSTHSHGWGFVFQCEGTAFTQILTSQQSTFRMSPILLLWENMNVTHLFSGLFLDNVTEH